MPAVNDIDVRAKKRAAQARRLAAPADVARPSRQSSRGPKRAPKPVISPGLRRAATIVMAIALAGGLGFGGYYAYRQGSALVGSVAAMVSGPQFSGMTVQDISVEGRKLVSKEAVMAALNVNRGDSLLSFDPRAARARLESIEWVESAIVERRLPDGIYVKLTERAAVALWQRDSDFVLIDRQGRVVRNVDPNYYGYLPLIAGAGAPDQITALSLLLQEVPEIGKRVRAAVWVGQRRWNITLDTMVQVMLPETDAAAALKTLAELDRKQQLLSRDLVSIDLRLPDRMVVKPAAPINPPTAKDDKGNSVPPKKPAAGPVAGPASGKTT
ncbi:MAG: cell division protein FtsQ/DivIB [Rhodospirillales bacterium]